MKELEFITKIKFKNRWYVGIVQIYNPVKNYIGIYAINSEKLSKNEIAHMINLGLSWWSSTNKKIPINVFLREKWIPYRKTLRIFNTKEVEKIEGPVISLGKYTDKSQRREIFLYPYTKISLTRPSKESLFNEFFQEETS